MRGYSPDKVFSTESLITPFRKKRKSIIRSVKKQCLLIWCIYAQKWHYAHVNDKFHKFVVNLESLSTVSVISCEMEILCGKLAELSRECWKAIGCHQLTSLQVISNFVLGNWGIDLVRESCDLRHLCFADFIMYFSWILLY